MALAVSEPADPRRQPLERHPLTGQLDPAVQALVVGELFQGGAVGGGDIGRVTRESHPPERAPAFAELRADVGGQEARIVEGPVVSAKLGLGAQTVAIVEHFGTGVHEPDHGLDVVHDRSPRPLDEHVWFLAPQPVGRLQRHIGGDVCHRVVGAGLIGDDVGVEPVGEQPGQNLGGIADESDR